MTSPPDPTSQSVEEQRSLVHGRPARVFVGGSGSRAVLLLHGGWGGARMHWSGVWDRLARRARVVAPDLPGLGDTTQPGLARVADYVTWLDALLSALDVREALVVGNSFGASLAWSFAGRRPERCTGVVLVDGVPMPRTPAPLLWLGRRPLGRGAMRAMLRRVSFTPRALPRAFADPSRVPVDLQASLHETPPVQLETFLDCIIAGDGPPTPRAPILVVWGEADHLPGTSLAAGRRLATKLSGARLVSIANAGHSRS